LGGFHLPEQGIHFHEAQLAVGPHGRVARHGGEQFIAVALGITAYGLICALAVRPGVWPGNR
ncbi:MAG: hypothetical protein EBT34_09835, partial [Acetobacteraceae bacterium]|nr:hypothetical protein [Acetobacteraceae bacterium]